MDKPVIIINASALGKAALDIFKSNEVVVYGFLDENKKLHGTEIDEISVLGSIEDDQYMKLLGESCDVFIASDDNVLKANLIKSLRKDYKVMPINAIHPNVHISATAVLHHGSMIGMGTKIGDHSSIGNHCLINAGALVDYHVNIGDFVQLGAGCVISAGATIEDGAFIGAGAIVVSGTRVGAGARVGAGSVVVADVQAKETVFGNPAKNI